MSALKGKFVLENELGQVVRTFHWQSPSLSLVYRKDNRRVQPVESLDSLDEQKISYVCLAQVTKAEVQKHSVKLPNGGQLKYVEEIESLSPSVVPAEDDPKRYTLMLKRTAAVNVAVLALILLIGFFVNRSEEKPEQHIVEIITKPAPQVVTPVVQKIAKKQHVPIKTKIVKRQTPRITQPTLSRNTHKTQVSLTNIGALGVLGSLSKSNTQGGLNVNAIKTSRGPGLGGAQGSGGVQASLYSKGLISAPLGPMARLNGEGGYGTRGKGGGQAGYGTMSLVGSGSTYFQPVSSEAVVEGGLDRDQIAAVIQRHLGQVRSCYEQGLQKTPQLRGRVNVKFLIGGNGFVSSASIANSSLQSEDVQDCIVSRLKGWKFPQPRGGVVVKVNYPFLLKRVSQG